MTDAVAGAPQMPWSVPPKSDAFVQLKPDAVPLTVILSPAVPALVAVTVITPVPAAAVQPACETPAVHATTPTELPLPAVLIAVATLLASVAVLTRVDPDQ